MPKKIISWITAKIKPRSKITLIKWHTKKYKLLRTYLKNNPYYKKDYSGGISFIVGFKEKIFPGAKRKNFTVRITPTLGESRISISMIVKNLGQNRLEKHPTTAHHTIVAEKIPRTLNKNNEKIICETPLKFTPTSIDIETIQGAHNAQPFFSHFENINHTQVEEALVREIENQARELGYSTIRIRDPKTIKKPIISNPHEEIEIKKRLTKRIHTLATKRGYEKQNEYYVKRL